MWEGNWGLYCYTSIMLGGCIICIWHGLTGIKYSMTRNNQIVFVCVFSKWVSRVCSHSLSQISNELMQKKNSQAKMDVSKWIYNGIFLRDSKSLTRENNRMHWSQLKKQKIWWLSSQKPSLICICQNFAFPSSLIKQIQHQDI